MQQRGKRLQTVMWGVVLLAAVFSGGYAVGLRDIPPIEKVTSLGGKEAPVEVLTDFSPFWQAWNVLNEKYVAATSTAVATDNEKLWGAINGLTASLGDPYTVFFPPEEAKQFESEIAGNFEGVGMEIGVKDDVLTVIAPLKGTPAERAGIRPGDKILKINDEVSTNLRVDQAVKLIRGKKGTEVRLTMLREGRQDPFEIKVVRDVIDIPTIDTELRAAPGDTASAAGSNGSWLREDGVFVVRLYNFSANSPFLFRDAVQEFMRSGSTKLLLDLRGNPGGFLDAAVDIASWFLPNGAVIVSEDSGGKGKSKVHRSRGYDAFNANLRMVILVNGGSASASEILAGALQEHGIATLVGQKTFGKGSVQELIKLTADTSLKVTVARWLTPKGVSISDGGLTPDVVVELTPEDLEQGRDPQMEKAVKILTTNH